MERAVWENLLNEVRRVHAETEELRDFCRFPNDLSPRKVEARHFPCADVMAQYREIGGEKYKTLRSKFRAASPFAHWRETYRETDIGDDFLDRFGCFNLIGSEGAFNSNQMWAWVVFMPPNLYYPWHHHPWRRNLFCAWW